MWLYSNPRFVCTSVTKPVSVCVRVQGKICLFRLKRLAYRNANHRVPLCQRPVLKPLTIITRTGINFLRCPFHSFTFSIDVLAVPQMSCSCNDWSSILESKPIRLLGVIHFTFGYDLAVSFTKNLHMPWTGFSLAPWRLIVHGVYDATLARGSGCFRWRQLYPQCVFCSGGFGSANKKRPAISYRSSLPSCHPS